MALAQLVHMLRPGKSMYECTADISQMRLNTACWSWLLNMSTQHADELHPVCQVLAGTPQ